MYGDTWGRCQVQIEVGSWLRTGDEGRGLATGLGESRAEDGFYEAVGLPTIKRLVLQLSLRSPSAPVADFLVETLRLIGISPPSAGHDAAYLPSAKIWRMLHACPASQPIR